MLEICNMRLPLAASESLQIHTRIWSRKTCLSSTVFFHFVLTKDLLAPFLKPAKNTQIRQNAFGSHAATKTLISFKKYNRILNQSPSRNSES